MRPAALLFALATAGLPLVGCAGVQGGLTGAQPDCRVLFRNYDQAIQAFGNSDYSRGDSQSWKVPTAVDRAGQRLRAQGCLTSADDLAATFLMSSQELRASLVGESGAPIEPISLHAGIVQGITSEVVVRQFFGGLGVRVRSQGAPGLGRRIYLGPFATEGGYAEATELALKAGFVAPYPARF